MNSSLCPVCGQANSCAQAASDSQVAHCWCFEVEITPQALDDLPPETLDLACLCPRCAQARPARER